MPAAGLRAATAYNVSVAAVLDRVLETIHRYSMFAPGDRVAVAVSGGADSVCLLHVLLEAAPFYELTLVVVHLDHQLRGEASRADADFVRALADRLQLPFLFESVDVRTLDPNVEQAGRLARRAFFQRVIEQGHVSRVALGHTRSDQAETVLYRLMRGSGGAGLCGIPPVSEMGFVRPLIDVSRHEVEKYLRRAGIAWREDATNTDFAFVRNRIRGSLLPMLARDYNPQIESLLATTAKLQQDDERFFADEVSRISGEVFDMPSGTVVVRSADLLALHPALGRRLARRALETVKGDLRSIEFHHVEAILGLAAQSEGSGRLQVPGVDVFRSFDWMRFAAAGRDNFLERNWSFEVEAPAEVVLPGDGTKVAVEVTERVGSNGKPGYNDFVSELNLEKTGRRLEVRNWRPGDRYRRAGKPASEKIKDLFQLFRIPLWNRRSWPIILAGGEIVWTRCFGPADEFQAAVGARTVLRVSDQAAHAGGQARVDKARQSPGRQSNDRAR